VDPAIIPLYGYGIKQILNEELGRSVTFDLAYLEPTNDYQKSKEIYEEILRGATEAEKYVTYKYIPEAIQRLSQRKGELTSKEIVAEAIILARNPQRKLNGGYI
jgi:hypothetical protein